MAIERMAFTKDWNTGAVTVDRFVDECEFHGSIFEEADLSVIRREGMLVRISVANGSADYRIVDERPDGGNGMIYRAVKECDREPWAVPARPSTNR
jgi:hypothetical protein